MALPAPGEFFSIAQDVLPRRGPCANSLGETHPFPTPIPMSEYYIRRSDSDEVRGPFNTDKLTTLVEAGQVDKETLYYDEDKQDWIPIASNEDLRAVVFAEKKRLNLRSKHHESALAPDPSEKSLTLEDSTRKEVKVSEILASAEGEAGAGWQLGAKKKAKEMVLGMTPALLGAMFAMSGAVLAWRDLDNLTKAFEDKDIMPLLREPLVLVGVVDFIFATLLFLWVSEIFPILRFRAMLGLGFFSYVAWNAGDYQWMVANVVASVAIFVCTLSTRLQVSVASMAAGVVAFGWMFVQKFFS